MSRRYDSGGEEERRQAFARLYGLPEDASWEQIDDAAQSADRRIEEAARALKEGIARDQASTSEERRLAMARAYGLGADAGWDEIYRKWKAYWGYGNFATKVLVFAGVPAAVILYLSTHWLALALAACVFVLVALILLLAWSLSLEDHYHGVVRQNPEILERAKRDRIYV